MNKMESGIFLKIINSMPNRRFVFIKGMKCVFKKEMQTNQGIEYPGDSCVGFIRALYRLVIN